MNMKESGAFALYIMRENKDIKITDFLCFLHKISTTHLSANFICKQLNVYEIWNGNLH
jgi:hypothetical protein